MHDAQPMLMMQHEVDGGSVAATIAVFASVWRVRVSCFALEIAPSVDALYELIIKCLDCPWLVRCAPSTDRKQRRQAQIRAPLPAHSATIYRSDGASRGQGQAGESQGGWGAAVWLPTPEGLGEGPPHGTARGYLGAGATNNAAEYTGLLACMRRAARLQDTVVVFQVDSLLASRQMARYDAWACRCEDLVPLRDRCRALGHELTGAGTRWEVVHIYREYNQCADQLANQGVEDRLPMVPSANW